LTGAAFGLPRFFEESQQSGAEPMLHHLFFVPFVIFHFIVTALLIATALIVLRPLAMAARSRCASSRDSAPRATHNAAFEDYRKATLKRLEQEADEFRAYLDRLRRSADAAAFEAFLNARRTGGQSAT
jgi:Protein of unknown function (DUF2852)